MSNQVGEEVIIEEAIEVEPVFGNGRSLKFFNALFRVLIYLDLIMLLKNIYDYYQLFIKGYNMDSVLFFSIYGNITTCIILLIGLYIVIRLIIYSVKNQAQEFAILYLWSTPISAVGVILSATLFLIQFPEQSLAVLNETIISLVLVVLIYIPIFIYLNKRLIKKPKNI